MNKDYKLYVHIAPNGKKYYGITKQKPEQRWKKGTGYNNQVFAKAINKYGWDNIEHIVLHEGLDEEEAKELEQYMIQWYDTTNPNYGYNTTLGGEGISGYNHTKETRQKISESHKGICHTEESRQKMSKSRKGKYMSKNNPAAKSVICITTNKVFHTGTEASLYYNFASSSHISACCRGKRNYCGKLPDGTPLVWKYIDIIEL